MNGNPLYSWKAGLEKMQHGKRCGAYCRTTGRPCQAPAMANGRCRMHGGKNPGAPCGKAHGNYKHGLRTQEAMAERQALRTAMAAILEIIKENSA